MNANESYLNTHLANEERAEIRAERVKELAKSYMQDGEEIKDLPADQYKLEAELIKAKKSYLEKLKHFPDTLGLWLVDPDQSEKEFDPYLKPEEIVL